MKSPIVINKDDPFIPFTPEDLAANKQGRLTERQLELIQDLYELNKKRSKSIPWGCIIFWCIVSVLHALFTLSGAFDTQDLMFAVVLFFMPVPLYLIAHRMSVDMTEELPKLRTTLSAVGKARKMKLYEHGRTGYLVIIDKTWFWCTESFFNLIEKHQSYAFYYVSGMGVKMVFSWEKIQDTNL